MEFKEIQLQLVLLFHFGLQIAYGVPTLSASNTPPVPVKGNNTHTVMCSYTTVSGESVTTVTLTRGTELIFTYFPINNITAWSNTVTDAFKQRVTKFGFLSTNVVGITYSNTMCSDEVSYRCEIVVISGGLSLSVSNSTTVSIEAPPQAPVQMIVNPNFQSIQEFNTVTFTCSGNVGKPAGTFHWYMFTAANGVNPDNVTLQASTESPVPASGDCTFTRRSSLVIRLLRKQTDLVVRCLVYHPTQVNNANPTNCTNPSAQLCQSSQSISVAYPVNVTVDSAIRQEVEGNIMILTCKPEANPEAWLEWFKSDSNVTLSNSPQLTFNRLTLADSGDYTCMGYNNISGVIYYASATVSVTVVPATLPPTTTTRTTMRATTHSSPDSVETTTSAAEVTTSHGHHDITCTESRMEFSIPLSSPHTSETATLSDPNCQINVTRTHVRGGVDLNSCGTTVQFQNDSVIFRNAIIFSAPESSSLGSSGSNSSVSQYQDIIPIQCVYNRIATVHLSYMPVVRRVLFTESGVGQFSFNIQQFWDASFTNMVSDRAYPLRMELDADVFIQLSVGSEGQPVAGHKEIGMEVQQCLVSPSSSVIEAQLHYYPLIQDGCPASSDVHIIPNTNASDSTVMRFRFRAVNFFDPSSSSSSSLVFVHCRMGLCLTGSCKPSAWSCLTPPARRVRRDVDQSKRAAHQLSTGPFLIMADEASTSSSSTTATVMAVVSTSVATVAIVIAAIALIALRRRRTTARN